MTVFAGGLFVMAGCGIKAGEGGEWRPEGVSWCTESKCWRPELPGGKKVESCGRRVFEQVN